MNENSNTQWLDQWLSTNQDDYSSFNIDNLIDEWLINESNKLQHHLNEMIVDSSTSIHSPDSSSLINEPIGSPSIEIRAECKNIIQPITTKKNNRKHIRRCICVICLRNLINNALKCDKSCKLSMSDYKSAQFDTRAQLNKHLKSIHNIQKETDFSCITDCPYQSFLSTRRYKNIHYKCKNSFIVHVLEKHLLSC